MAPISSKCTWATSWENLFMPYANNKGADQPVHPRSLISAFVVRCLDHMIPLVSIPEISSLYLAAVAAQAGWSLPWSQTPKTGFLVMRLTWIVEIYWPGSRWYVNIVSLVSAWTFSTKSVPIILTSQHIVLIECHHFKEERAVWNFHNIVTG